MKECHAFASGCVRKPASISLPGGGVVFHFFLVNSQEIIVSCQHGVVSIFDMPLDITCSEIRLYVDDIVENYSCIGVQAVMDRQSVTVGDLILSEDLTVFDAEVIGVEFSKRLWSKAVTLYGSTAS